MPGVHILYASSITYFASSLTEGTFLGQIQKRVMNPSNPHLEGILKEHDGNTDTKFFTVV